MFHTWTGVTEWTGWIDWDTQPLFVNYQQKLKILIIPYWL